MGDLSYVDVGHNPDCDIFRLGSYRYERREDVEESRDYYSKSYHRQYGPKVVVSNRRLVKLAYKPLVGAVVVKEWALVAWRQLVIDKIVVGELRGMDVVTMMGLDRKLDGLIERSLSR